MPRDHATMDDVDPFYMALLRSRQRRFQESIDICSEILTQNPYDQVNCYKRVDI
jgi:tRNA isopentenyl-2-thiomethyl-A-37 hydroxylase MiaE